MPDEMKKPEASQGEPVAKFLDEPKIESEVKPEVGSKTEAAKAAVAKAGDEPKGAPKKKGKEIPAHGQAHVTATYNNTIVTLTDIKGNVVGWSSAGKCGFKGAKKSTAYAAGIVVKDASGKCVEMGLREVDVFIKGVGAGREAAVRALNANGLNVLIIKDVTPIPHNGPRPRKVRRV